MVFSMLLLVMLPTVQAERLCPEGKSHLSDQCEEVHWSSSDTFTVNPLYKSQRTDEVKVGKKQADGSYRVCPKGKSHRSDLCYTLR